MPLNGTRTYVGFGFGAIQTGLFLYEAFQSGNFKRLVIAEIVPDVVREIRDADGYYTFNIAHADRIEAARVGPVEIYDPGVSEDREQIIQALADADEIGTAVPSVSFYVSDRPGSIHRVLAEGLVRKAEQDGPLAVVYAAENHNEAAEILEEHVRAATPEGEWDAISAKTRFLNTVIGKMSGLVEDPARDALATITPDGAKAFLVEVFNRILVSKVRFEESFERGISVFEEKEDLLPFEEAKLYGHNSTHALGAYLGRFLGVERIGALRDVPGFVPFMRDAFLLESGACLTRKHAGIDPLFTDEGYMHFADDLLERMTNPYLKDTIERVGRDPQRKTGWDDRLVGTIRTALTQGVDPMRYALGAAAGLAALDKNAVDDGAAVARVARDVWAPANPNEDEVNRVLGLIERGRCLLEKWKSEGYPNLTEFWKKKTEDKRQD